MADRIIAGQDAPTSHSAIASSDAADLLEKKLSQLQSLLKCCYGDCCSEWFDAIGVELRDHVMWIAADLAEDVVNLSQDLLKKINAAEMPDG
ncbi:hypothetical protein A3K87_03800 [Variovorax paradoxus]|uniref:Uncharacterized protein n=1 Tax=Variovorax paradoxus TaxID=34073 RepID=A0AA91I7X1_VARPD|nr:hypothetical protein [Variovorax paradoxus]OAK57022.1 hypothetical protein A3K87_03800 [Variovorax paradoxus]